jgi:hypothetical protein
MTVKELNARMQRARPMIWNFVRGAVLLNKDALLDMNRHQMLRGIDPDGQQFMKYKSVEYADIKKQAGSIAPFMIPDLKLTGSFQEKMILRVSQRDYVIHSTDEKSNKLESKYHPFGLTDNHKEKALEINTKTFSEIWRKNVGLS